MVPHLVTALNGPLLDLEKKILDATPAIERWFRMEWQEHTPPFYCSVDLRNAGFKLAPVDTNLFPGGFNNLSPEMLPLAVQAAMAAIEKYCPDARNLLLIPENQYTRNTFYLQNLARLIQIFRQTGLNVRLGALSGNIEQPGNINLPDGSTMMLEPLERSRNGRRLGLKNFDPCTILLNNDLSGGIPAVLENLNEQNVLPPLHAGWAVRRKSNHFAAYDEVVKKFSKLVDVDPWMLDPLFAKCEEIDFQTGAGIDCLADNVSSLLSKIRRKYKEYGIKEQPFVIVKANAGTYGMGIMTVRDANEVKDLNHRQRDRMALGKEGLKVSDVILQEGVHSFERINEAVAEPVVYMIDRYVIGGFYRVHADRDVNENLNAPGAHFV
ncbi:MAG TPA: glutamate--cysteine ligase, partial [Herbaspirillum sp.]|nr:glutamate--cysteine ligase [Herbaspirillum sp.]